MINMIIGLKKSRNYMQQFLLGTVITSDLIFHYFEQLQANMTYALQHKIAQHVHISRSFIRGVTLVLQLLKLGSPRLHVRSTESSSAKKGSNSNLL